MSAYIGTGSNLSQKVWRPGVTHQAEWQTLCMSFVSSDDDACFLLHDDLTKKRGDTIQANFSPTGESAGLGDQAVATGNEQEVDTLRDTFVIDYLGEAWRTRGVMSQQRVDFDQKKQIAIKAIQWWKRRWDRSILAQLAGWTPAMYIEEDSVSTPQSSDWTYNAGTVQGYKFCGNNPVTAPDSAHIIYPTGETTDEGLDSTGDELTLERLQDALEACMDLDRLDYPIPPGPDGYYHCIMHPKQWQQLRESTTTNEWADITRAQIEGGKSLEETGWGGTWLGEWNKIRLHVSTYIPYGVNSSTAYTNVTAVRRAVFFGANALWIGFGEGYADGDHLDWSEHRIDHRKWSIMVDSVFGCKTAIFNSQNYGCIVLPSYTG